MIRHICMFTLKEENKEANKKEFFKRAESLKAIETIKRFEVVGNSDEAPSSNYDVALIFDFENLADLNVYQKSPIHLEFAEFVFAVREGRACIDYEI